MKKIGITIVLLLSIGAMVEAQSGKRMNFKTFKSPLKKGKNEIIYYKALEITPTNLFIQDKPWNDKSAAIQLELTIKENDKTFPTYLWYSEIGKGPATNYPMASGGYIYSLQFNKQLEVQLVVDTLDFENPFFINLSQVVKVGDLSINFKEAMDVMGKSMPGDPPSNMDSYAEYNLILSDKKEGKTLSFSSLNVYDKPEKVLEWKEYQIIVLESEINSLKLLVKKNAIAK